MKYIIVLLFILLLSGQAYGFANNINLRWVDEDTNTLLAPTITINGDSITVTNGVSDYNTNAATAEVTATLNGYLNKSLSFGFPGDSNILYTANLLSDTNAQNIQFRQRTETGGTLITDANILIIDLNTGNIVGASIIGGDSLFNAVLKPSGKDYNFMVTGSGITDFNYSKQELIVNNVIDERTLIDLGGTGTVTVSNPGSFIYGTLEPGDLLLTDNFTGSDADPPDISKWFIFNMAPGNGIVDIEDNDLNFYINGSNNVVSVLSDLNFNFNIGDIKEVEFTSVARPVGVGSEQYAAGWVTDNNANPQTSELAFNIHRSDSGALSFYHGHTTTSTQIDNGAGEKKFKVRITRTGGTTYKSDFFIDDSNLMATFTDTVSHHIYKVEAHVRAGAGGPVTGKFDTLKVRTLRGSLIFPYTVEYYSTNIDFNSAYFSRTYKNRLTEETSLTIQPYLVNKSDGVSTTIRTIESADITTPVTNIRVVTKKQLAGTVEVESIITDDKGEALQSYIVGDSYILEFYNSADTLLFTKNIEATSITLFVFIADQNAGFVHTGQKSVIIGFTPSAGRVISTTTLTQTVTVSNITISRVEVVVENNDINVFDTNYTVGVANGFTNDIIVSVLGGDTNSYLMTVYVFLSDNTVSVRKTTYTLPVGVDLFNLLSVGFKEDLGCSENCTFFMMLSFVITLLALAAFRATIGDFGGTTGLIAIGIILLGIFTYITWVPFGLFAVIAFIGVAFAIGSGGN